MTLSVVYKGALHQTIGVHNLNYARDRHSVTIWTIEINDGIDDLSALPGTHLKDVPGKENTLMPLLLSHSKLALNCH